MNCVQILLRAGVGARKHRCAQSGERAIAAVYNCMSAHGTESMLMADVCVHITCMYMRLRRTQSRASNHMGDHTRPGVPRCFTPQKPRSKLIYEIVGYGRLKVEDDE